MNWESIALAAATVLLPYLSKAGEAAAQKVGQDMYNWLKQQFKEENDEGAIGEMTILENDPTSKAQLELLSKTIRKLAEHDPEDFGKMLNARVQEIKQQSNAAGRAVTTVLNAKNVNIINGDVNTIIQN